VSGSSSLDDPIAGTADGLYRRPPKGTVDLVAQSPYVDVDDVGARLIGRVPGVLQQLEAQVADLQHDRTLGPATASERAQTGAQLSQSEGLDQIVVGPAVEAGHPVGHGLARGKHQHRSPDAALAQYPADLKAR